MAEEDRPAAGQLHQYRQQDEQRHAEDQGDDGQAKVHEPLDGAGRREHEAVADTDAAHAAAVGAAAPEQGHVGRVR